MHIWKGILLTAVCGVVQADHRLEYSETGGGLNVLEVGHQAVRMQQQGESQWMLYRHDEKAFYLVDSEQRSYQKMDQSTGQAMNQQLQALQAQMEAQLAGMPPEQREMMKQMMPKMPGLGQPVEYTVKPSGDTRKVAGYSCQPVTVFKEGEPEEELCLGSPKELGIAQNDFALLKGMGELMSEVAASFGAGSMAAVLEEMDGLPVEHRAPGAKEPKATLTASRDAKLDAERFALPAGYSERELIPGQPQ